jgi:hypothetical protein
MAQPHGERDFSPMEAPTPRCASAGSADSNTRLHPVADIIDEERLVRAAKTFRDQCRRVLLEPRVVIGEPVDTERSPWTGVGGLEDSLNREMCHVTVTGEHDGVGAARRDRNTVTWRPPS